MSDADKPREDGAVTCGGCAELRKQRDELQGKLDQIGRMVDIASDITDAQSEAECAASASFNEALALTMLEKAEKQREAAMTIVLQLVQEIRNNCPEGQFVKRWVIAAETAAQGVLDEAKSGS